MHRYNHKAIYNIFSTMDVYMHKYRHVCVRYMYLIVTHKLVCTWGAFVSSQVLHLGCIKVKLDYVLLPYPPAHWGSAGERLFIFATAALS